VPPVQQRTHSLDGLRGLAAIAVLLYHFITVFAPTLVPGRATTASPIVDTPLSVLYNGPYAVLIFFVMSGFVISGAADRNRNLLLTLPLRYFRLAAPAAFAALYGWAMLTSFCQGGAVCASAGMPDAAGVGHAASGVLGAAYEGAVGVFLTGRSHYNYVLWTMKVELIGSLAIYVLYALCTGRARIGALLLLGLAPVLLHNFQYEAFVAGALMREFRSRLPLRFAAPAILFGLLMGAVYTGLPERWGLQSWPAPFAPGDSRSLWYMVGATALVYGVLVSPTAERWLGSTPMQWLGRLSFPLYLAHVPLLNAVFARQQGVAPVGLVFCEYVAASLAAAWLIMRLVEDPVLAVIRAVSSTQRRAMAPSAALSEPSTPP
jgi:peptidoglycan/LPS O-acetylase OafA/YrhL